ncbi:mitochondrial glycine decarboxylase complex subunit H, partial [Ochromonadaceae sp. CCMP2298]
GEVIEINSELDSNPAVVNESPFVAGWFMKLKITNKADLDSLMDEAAYKKHCEDEAH